MSANFTPTELDSLLRGVVERVRADLTEPDFEDEWTTAPRSMRNYVKREIAEYFYERGRLAERGKMLSERLRACPFCGSRSLDDTCMDHETTGARRRFYFVYCNQCQSDGPTDYERDEAIRLWNKRREPDDDEP